MRGGVGGLRGQERRRTVSSVRRDCDYTGTRYSAHHGIAMHRSAHRGDHSAKLRRAHRFAQSGEVLIWVLILG